MVMAFSLTLYHHCLNHHVGLCEKDKRMSLEVYSLHVFFKKNAASAFRKDAFRKDAWK